jgi:hypothetical protein
MQETARGPVWEGKTYQRIAPGRYAACATRVQGPEWVRRFKRWSIIVEFELLGEMEATRVCLFCNMGNKAEPAVGRHSKYFKSWTIVNGEMPHKGQRMTPEVFLEGQVYEIEVDDCGKDMNEEPKSDAEIYSVVTRIVSANRANRPILNPLIRNHESSNHAIKQSTNQVGQQVGTRKVSSNNVTSFASAGRR